MINEIHLKQKDMVIGQKHKEELMWMKSQNKEKTREAEMKLNYSSIS